MQILINYLNNNILEITSFSLALFSIWLSYWFWKNPIDISFKSERTLIENEGTENEIYYKVGKDHSGWMIEKIIINDTTSGNKFRSFASAKNNPSINKTPETLNDIKGLHFD